MSPLRVRATTTLTRVGSKKVDNHVAGKVAADSETWF